MAQWTGQFTGKTHLSKVRDREELLRHAIAVYREQSGLQDRQQQATKVHRLADRLLQARVRAMKAKLNALGPRPPESPVRERMEARIQRALEGGVPALLEEFDAADVSPLS